MPSYIVVDSVSHVSSLSKGGGGDESAQSDGDLQEKAKCVNKFQPLLSAIN